MDEFVARFGAAEDGDLMLCLENGCAYQRDMSISVPYDDAYFDKYVGYEGHEIARGINAARIGLVNKYAGDRADVLDVGIGSGEFLRQRPRTFGFDVNPKAERWLKSWLKWSDDFASFRAFTFWDVLEHVPTPTDYFDRIASGSLLFTSLPIFDDLKRVRESKHYRPNEHYYYWTRDGFVAWMALHGFWLLECNDDETKAGRESILSFAFRRD